MIAVFAICIGNAQDITDGLRYSTDANSGTARFNALSGAFGALGGDFSAIGINPAGGAVFIKSAAAGTISGMDTDNSSTYFNGKTKSIDTDVNLNQAGAIFIIKKQSENSKLNKISVGFNYQTTQNYNNELFIKGSGNTSIGEFFRNQAEGVSLELLQLQSGESISDLYAYLGENEGTSAQNAFLGYQGFIIDPIDSEDPFNTQYYSNIVSGNFDQEYLILSEGGNNKFSINVAAQVNDKFYFGINLNTHTIDYQQRTLFYEDNSNEGSSIGQVIYENNLGVDGIGFSAQIGAIVKIKNNFRVGLSLESPTWYSISEEAAQYLETRSLGFNPELVTRIDPRVLNIYENYNLSTPGKVTASAAYIFGTQALISFDYSFKDFGSIDFDTFNYDSNDFNELNNSIEDTLKGASSFRLGGEYRINQLSLRAGLRYEESPYKKKETSGDLSGFSLGFGYNFGNYNLDLSYARAEQERKQQLYATGLTDSASIDSTLSTIALTFGFTF